MNPEKIAKDLYVTLGVNKFIENTEETEEVVLSYLTAVVRNIMCQSYSDAFALANEHGSMNTMMALRDRIVGLFHIPEDDQEPKTVLPGSVDK